MRRILVLVFLAALAQVVLAQQPATLSLSKSMVAVKITDPLRQLTVFKSVLARVDVLGQTANPKEQPPSAALTSMFAMVTRAPGVNTTGDYWILVFPPSTGGQGNAPSPVTALIPLSDPATFANGLAQARMMFPQFAQLAERVQIAEKFALVRISDVAIPKYTEVNTDIELRSQNDVVISMQMAALPLQDLQAINSPLVNILKSVTQNQQRNEAGLRMDGDDLVIESYTLPVPESPLAKSLTNYKTSPLPETLAGFLPENLAYCSSSGPMMEGVPGAGSLGALFIGGALSMSTGGEQHLDFQVQLKNLIALCGQGRAIGLTKPATPDSNDSTLVAVYHIDNIDDASATVLNFVEESIKTRDMVGGGFFKKVINISHKPAGEKISGIQVDKLDVQVNLGNGMMTDAKMKANFPETINLECYIGYTGDKMLFTAGAKSREQMVALIQRVKDGTATYTNSKQFAQMKVAMPQGEHGFYSFASQDVAHALISLLQFEDTQRGNANAFLAQLPSPSTAITGFQECQGDCLRDESRIPGEQLDYFTALIQSMMKLNMAKAKE